MCITATTLVLAVLIICFTFHCNFERTLSVQGSPLLGLNKTNKNF